MKKLFYGLGLITAGLFFLYIVFYTSYDGVPFLLDLLFGIAVSGFVGLGAFMVLQKKRQKEF